MFPQEFLSPLLRHAVGFDRMADMLNSMNQEQSVGYPPYNIEKINEDEYQISMAVAGFGEDDIEVTVDKNQLVVTGKHYSESEDSDGDSESGEGRTFLHRGIAERSFERRFSLAEHIQVEEAKMDKGLLHVRLLREVPESAKARRIAIGGSAKKKA